MALDTIIDVHTLAANRRDNGWRIVDCRFDLADTGRGRRDYAKAHIPGAWYAHLDHDLSGTITPETGRHPLPDAASFCAWLGQRGIEPADQVIAYDDSGGTMAVRLWWLLRWLGYRNVAILDGGWPAWREAGLPTTSDLPANVVTTRPTCRTDEAMVVDTSTIQSHLEQADETLLLVDARTAERFRGESEPIDPVAGHIPGALNLPLQSNLQATGHFKSPEALRALYLSLLGDRPPEQVVAMCGSGVTACHNLLAMAIAGLGEGRLYAGSWSEWIRDPTRPVATSIGD